MPGMTPRQPGRRGRLEGEGFDYQKIVQDALRDAVRRILAEVAEHGIPGEHFFYVGFRTTEPGVEIPRSLSQQYPQEMTVVLQNQFWDLEVGPDSFSVLLSFHGARQRLTIPFAALTAFVDPSAEFGLRFDGEPGGAANGPKAIPREDDREDGEDKAEVAEDAETPILGPRPVAERHGAVVPFDPKRRR